MMSLKVSVALLLAMAATSVLIEAIPLNPQAGQSQDQASSGLVQPRAPAPGNQDPEALNGDGDDVTTHVNTESGLNNDTTPSTTSMSTTTPEPTTETSPETTTTATTNTTITTPPSNTTTPSVPTTTDGGNSTTTDGGNTTTTATTTSSTSTSSTSPTTPLTTSTTPDPNPDEPGRRFDGWSFFGGIVLTLVLIAIGFVGYKYYGIRQRGQGGSRYNQF